MSTAHLDQPGSAAAPARQSPARVLLGTGVGNAMEWFDWNIYASFAAFFSGQLFNDKNPTSAFLSTMAVFAVGFVARPFGGALFGWIADHIGRKHSMMLAVACASVGSLLIAVCPTYSQVGWMASALLVLARLVQGLAHGGELPSAQTYLSEEAPPARRGLWSSAIYISGTIGMLAGMIIGLILSSTLTKGQMSSFGWRIPFLIGAVFGFFAIWMRARMEESQVFESDVQERRGPRVNPFVASVRDWRRGLQVIFLTSGLTITYYVWSVTMTSLAQKTLGFSASQAFVATIIGTLVLIVSLAPWGAISDRIGRKPCLLISTVSCAILYVPLTHLIKDQTWQLAVAVSIMLFFMAANLSIVPAVFAEMFTTGNRASGMAIPYAIAVAGFGGTAPYVMAAWSKSPGRFTTYAITMLVVSALTTLTIRETKGIDLHSRAEHAAV